MVASPVVHSRPDEGHQFLARNALVAVRVGRALEPAYQVVPEGGLPPLRRRPGSLVRPGAHEHREVRDLGDLLSKLFNGTGEVVEDETEFRVGRRGGRIQDEEFLLLRGEPGELLDECLNSKPPGGIGCRVFGKEKGGVAVAAAMCCHDNEDALAAVGRARR